MSLIDTWIIRRLGVQDYVPVWQAMQSFTNQRDLNTADECWLVEHSPVFTQGQAGKAEHVLSAGDIPVIQADRGGQVTYHGPGQLVAYLLIDLKRRSLGVRDLVTAIEAAIVSLLADYAITAAPREDAPGVYVDSGAKIAQLGLRVRKGCSFHGLSLNVAMDMSPFQQINPCGHAGMSVTNMAIELKDGVDFDCVSQQLVAQLETVLGYNARQIVEGFPSLNSETE
ncbi:lipoyl(octanoyl) transferase LipB [bacterium]|nr:lipoyl(octanoyl) transferase LipB [bacterium]